MQTFSEMMASPEDGKYIDWDVASYGLALSLGVIPNGVEFSPDAKFVFWTNNPLGSTLHDILIKLREVGFLSGEPGDPTGGFLLNPDFSWETASGSTGPSGR